MNDDDMDILLLCAFRYALGRRTYIVSWIADIIIDNWSSLKPRSKKIILKEIKEAIENGEFYIGMKCDEQDWRRVLLHGEKENTNP